MKRQRTHWRRKEAASQGRMGGFTEEMAILNRFGGDLEYKKSWQNRFGGDLGCASMAQWRAEGPARYQPRATPWVGEVKASKPQRGAATLRPIWAAPLGLVAFYGILPRAALVPRFALGWYLAGPLALTPLLDKWSAQRARRGASAGNGLGSGGTRSGVAPRRSPSSPFRGLKPTATLSGRSATQALRRPFSYPALSPQTSQTN